MSERVLTYSFCDHFIDRLADHIKDTYAQNTKDLSRLVVVFGGKRPALFLQRALAKRLKTVFIPPKMFTIDEFISYTVRKKNLFTMPLDLDSCYILYKIAQQHVPEILEGRSSFSQFLPWTKEILQFIDQLDLEHIDLKNLENIQANAQIGYDVPEDINRMLNHIVKLRDVYHAELSKQGYCSRGLQYLTASQVVDTLDYDEFDDILFCNFFYFNRSEEKVVKSLYDRGKAKLFFQGDQRRWPVIDRIARRFNFEVLEGEKPLKPAFDLKLYCGFDVHSQIAQVREILKNTPNLEQTVVVLPNADNIVPLISEINSLIGEFNISMGYPLKRSSLYTLFDLIFRVQLSKKDNRYYTKDYLAVLKHPFVKNLEVVGDRVSTRILVHKLEEILTGKEVSSCSGQLFIDLNDILQEQDIYALSKEMLERLKISIGLSELREILTELHNVFFNSWQKIDRFRSFGESIEYVLNILIEKSTLCHYPLNNNIAQKMLDIKDEFIKAKFSDESFEIGEIFRIFENKISKEIVAFKGSPLKGLQLLGLFETRSLNFENVVVLDVNEGVLPHLNLYEPLIPREVMISLNLDRLELEEEIQRYQFMRLISSAKNVHLVYQKSKDKERSRFVEELIWDEQKTKNTLDVLPVTQAGFQLNVLPRKVSIKKTPQMIEYLKTHRYSASSLNMYLRNPVDFYYSYVLGLKEKEDMLDEPEARHIGTFIHEILETCYKPLADKKPSFSKGFFRDFEQMFEEKFSQRFGQSMKSDSILLKSVVKERLNRFLETEETNRFAQIRKIMFLEKRFEDIIPLAGEEIRFSYVVDRVDEMTDGTVMILDYKTGSTDLIPSAYEELQTADLSRELIRDTLKSFQIPLYYRYLNKEFKDRPINAALYNLRTMKVDSFLDHSKVHPEREVIDQIFTRALDFILREILNPKIDFVEDESVTIRR